MDRERVSGCSVERISARVTRSPPAELNDWG